MSALFAQAYLMFGVKHGLNPQELCATAGISPADVANRESQIPYVWAEALGRQLIARLPQLAVGIELGRFGSIEQLGYLGHALRNCQTPLEALKLLVRHARLLDSAYRDCALVPDARDGVSFRAPTLSPPDLPEWIEMGFVNIVTCLRAVDPALVPREVRFAHDRSPTHHQRLAEAFACPVSLRRTDNALVFEHDAMVKPIAGADPEARRHFETYVREAADRLVEPLPTVVSRVIASRLDRGDLSQAQLAKLLGLSTRSLRRALHAHGTSYQQIMTEARLARVETLLAKPELAIYEIALALGYDDVSTFNRAFRQWFGRTPRAHREWLAAARAGGTLGQP